MATTPDPTRAFFADIKVEIKRSLLWVWAIAYLVWRISHNATFGWLAICFLFLIIVTTYTSMNPSEMLNDNEDTPFIILASFKSKKGERWAKICHECKKKSWKNCLQKYPDWFYLLCKGQLDKILDAKQLEVKFRGKNTLKWHIFIWEWR